MKRTTLIAGLALAVLGIAALLLLRQPEKGNRGAEPSQRPIPSLTASSFDTIEVVRGQGAIVITKDGSGFRIAKPVGHPADPTGASQAFDALTGMEFVNLVSDQKSRHSELEVGEDGLRVVLRKGEKVVADLRIGKTVNKLVMVREQGKDEVWSVSGLGKNLFDKDVTTWRDKTIARFDEKAAEKLLVTSKSGSLIFLSRTAGSDGGPASEWSVVQSSVKAEPLDRRVVSEVVSQLASLSASDFTDDAATDATGLDKPELVVIATLRDGTQHSVLVGHKRSEDEVYVKRGDWPQVFVVKKANLDRMNKAPADFRRKVMCELGSEEITEVVVTQPIDPFVLVKQANGWTMSRPAGVELDSFRVARLVRTFAEWNAGGIAEGSSPKVTGLDKPVATVLAKTKDKNRFCQIEIGRETEDKNSLYVKAASMPEVLTVPKWSIGQVVVRISALKKP